jgi:ATP-binding cassette, subfamily B, bacterial
MGGHGAIARETLELDSRPAPLRRAWEFERDLAARRLARESGAITLLVSHRFSTVRMADLIIVLDQGRVLESGDDAALVRVGGLYAELYDLQARAYS